METQLDAVLIATLNIAVQFAFCVRVILRANREPASRIAWIVVIVALQGAGVIAYILFGEVNIGWRRVRRMRDVLARMPDFNTVEGLDADHVRPVIPERYAHLFRTGYSINGFEPLGGNCGRLLEDSYTTIDAIAADIDAARDHVHLLFYIWLPDNSGRKIAAALKRAASRGVICRAMADGLGSRAFINSPHWAAMQKAGVRLAVALSMSNPLLRIFKGRIDLRNHRKIVVIDDSITYCGSQNCASPAFHIKARYAPWIDAVVRFEGPIVRQNQYLFAADWMAHMDEDLGDLLRRPLPQSDPGLTAQVIGTGPTTRFSAMPEMFETLIYTARHELIISTPYYVPNESMQAALCASARRGVSTTMIFPARNDSRIVAAASRSYYAELLEAGVRIFEFKDGLLHTKSLTLDGDISLIGSANMDRRSFDLNYENNILLYDPRLTAEIRQRQHSYITRSSEITAAMVADWPVYQRLLNNTVAMFGPVL